ncbi:MAG: arylmalonate decarboxylase [Acetobacteraceae bacterium]|nr:arylmalonate decarboxylase [Acetobacteraceae bacterium]
MTGTVLMGVVAPATNITVQPEMEALRPPGVINAHARIPHRDQAVRSDGDALAVRAAMIAGLMDALDTLAPARPRHGVIGVMVENFAGGGEAGAALLREAEARIGCPVTDVSSSLLAALDALFGRRARIAVLTPFMPVGDAAARRLFEEAGHEVLQVTGLRAPGPAAIARLADATIRDALRALDGPEVEAIVQVGTNLPFATLAVEAEAALGKPVLACNPVTYWRALRRVGITAPLPGDQRLHRL